MSTATALAPVGQWTRTGLDLPAATSYDEWLRVGERLHEMEQSVMWWIGDWLIFGEKAFADRFAKASELTGYSFDRLRDARRVASAFPPQERSDKLGWSAHRVTVGLPKDQRGDVLHLAEENGWSCRDVRFEVSRRAVGIERGEGYQPLELPDPAAKSIKRTGRLIQAAFSDWFGLGDEYARVLLGLFQAGGNPQDWRALAKFVSSHQPMARGALQEAIHVLREAMEAEAIDRDDNGYWLTEVGFAECRKAFRELGRQLIGMGAEPANDLSPIRPAELETIQ